MFALGMHFRREKEKQEAEKRRARIQAIEKAKKKAATDAALKQQKQQQAAVVAAANAEGTGPVENGRTGRDRSSSQSSGPPPKTSASGSALMIRSTDDFGRMAINVQQSSVADELVSESNPWFDAVVSSDLDKPLVDQSPAEMKVSTKKGHKKAKESSKVKSSSEAADGSVKVKKRAASKNSEKQEEDLTVSNGSTVAVSRESTAPRL